MKLPYEWEHIQWNCGVGYITVDSLYAEGEYSYRMVNELGCDSIDSLSLRIHSTYAFTEAFTICQSETPYAWQGIEDIYTSGTYTKSYLTHDGYDSTYTATITVVPTFTIHEDTTVHIARGDSILWDGRYYYASGDYDSIGNALDMDSAHNYCKYVKTLHLFVDSTYYYRDTLEICEKQNKEMQYHWKDGHTMLIKLPNKDTALHYFDSLRTLIYRFDSIYDLYVDYHVRPQKLLFDTITATPFSALW